MADTTIRINEIFHSIQGESLLAGKPSAFIRTSACNLRCVWCDTKYAYWKGKVMSIPEILEAIKPFESDYACVTGGEPLGQKGTIELLKELIKKQYTVSLETNGSFSVKDVPKEVIKVVDFKCPDSGESKSMCWENVEYFQKQDQVKFVVSSKVDFDWAEETSHRYQLDSKCTILYSPVQGKVRPAELANWILNAKAPVTMQVQMHKEIWGADETGV